MISVKTPLDKLILLNGELFTLTGVTQTGDTTVYHLTHRSGATSDIELNVNDQFIEI